MKRTACVLFAVMTVGTLSGCVASLPDQAKLLAAIQECGRTDLITRYPALAELHDHCVMLQLDAMAAQEVAYERRQADVLAGLSKALESR